MQNLTILASVITEIPLGASKFKVGHVTLTMQNLTILASAILEILLEPTTI